MLMYAEFVSHEDGHNPPFVGLKTDSIPFGFSGIQINATVANPGTSDFEARVFQEWFSHQQSSRF